MFPSRRTLLGGLSFWPLAKAKGAKSRRGIYQDLGIRPVINFRGTHTVIGASKVWPEIHDAMAEASAHYVSLQELQDAVGTRLAKLIGTEDAMVTTGTAGGITLGTCASLTGDDTAKIRRLPDLSGMKSEVIIQKAHRNGYDHAVRNTGVRIVDVASLDELRAAAGERTAMMYYLGGSSGDWAWETPVPLAECLVVAREKGFPVLVDAANMLPPWDNLTKLAATGVDLIAISGGKHMRGPQCSGILAGRRDLVRAARLNSNPYSDSLGRGLKAGREEIVGVWMAAEKYSRLDFAALDRQSQSQAEYLVREIARIPGLRTRVSPHDRVRRVHRVIVEWDEQERGITAPECEKQLIEGEPRIAVLREGKGVMFTVFMNEPGDEKLVPGRLREIFNKRPA